MADAVALADVVARAITAGELVPLVHGDADGAVVTFEGIVRDHDRGRGVVSLDYEAHDSAVSRLEDVARTIVERHPGVSLAVTHRIGALRVGDVALAAAVASAHRGGAFAACSDLVDLVKAEVPIWKRQVFDDGGDEWVGSL